MCCKEDRHGCSTTSGLPTAASNGRRHRPAWLATRPAAYGGFWIRVLAYIVDAVVLGILGGVLSVPLGVDLSDLTSMSETNARASNTIDLVLACL